MKRLTCTFVVAYVVIFSLLAHAQADDFVHGNYYATDYGLTTIYEYDSAGNVVVSISPSLGSGETLRGLAFGPDGLLYATVTSSVGKVIALNHDGAIDETYLFSAFSGGNTGFGKIAFGNNDKFYVGSGAGTVELTIGDPISGNLINSADAFDIRTLPNGNILIANPYQITEVASDGSYVRTIEVSDPYNVANGAPVGFGDIRGIEYDPIEDVIYATQLGYSGFNFQLMKMEALTGNLLANQFFWYGNDIFINADGGLVVGSGTQAPGLFNSSLNYLGSFSGENRLFVTQYVSSRGGGSTTIVPDALNVFRGFQIGGSLEDVFESDDSNLKFNPGITLSSTEPPVWIEFEGTFPSDSPIALAVTLEAQANTSGLTQTIEMFDYNSGQYEQVDARAATNNDSVVTIDLTTDITDYVESGTGAVKARVGWRATGPLALFPWTICIDQLAWSVSRD